MKNVVKEIISTILYILAVLLGTYLLITFVGQRTSVSGSSMEPTLSNNDQLILDKISYRFSEPKRFDIIVFPFQYKENTYYVKRVIGLPGETVQIKGGFIFINGEVLSVEDGLEQVSLAGRADTPIQLEEDEYFLLGDNRDSSEDSRFSNIGNVKREQIYGKVWFRILPLLKLDFIHSK